MDLLYNGEEIEAYGLRYILHACPPSFPLYDSWKVWIPHFHLFLFNQLGLPREDLLSLGELLIQGKKKDPLLTS